MIVDIEDRQKALPICGLSVSQVVEAVLEHEGHSCDEVCIHFIEQEEIKELHRQYFNDPTPTDCITFPMDGVKQKADDFCMLGDIFVCPEVALKYAQKHRQDPYEETTLYVVHGLLHLMGYNDIEDLERDHMRAAEKRHMDNLKEKKTLLKDK